MIETVKLKEIVGRYLEGTDKYLVDVEIRPDNKILIEIDGDQAISIDDCVDLTRCIESQLNREEEDYELEVGSAGISQAFKVLRQYKKNTGNEVEVLLKTGMKYAGILKEAGDQHILLTVEKQIKPEGAKRKICVQEDVRFDYHEIKYTKNIIRFK
ncbi:MAG: ribosome assembly cofactor RimP [Candidatus Azobacteroides sp.]|nr:ribosome assembly cofactor RimP [Candidatus Azobacteroides sp.]